MSPKSSWLLRVGKCAKNAGKIEFLTHERIHMLDMYMGDVAIFKRISRYILGEEATCLRSHRGHFVWVNVQKTQGKSSF